MKVTKMFCDECGKEIKDWGVGIGRIGPYYMNTSLDYIRGGEFCSPACATSYLCKEMTGRMKKEGQSCTY